VHKHGDISLPYDVLPGCGESSSGDIHPSERNIVCDFIHIDARWRNDIFTRREILGVATGITKEKK
jgi:hypothetical protein